MEIEIRPDIGDIAARERDLGALGCDEIALGGVDEALAIGDELEVALGIAAESLREPRVQDSIELRLGAEQLPLSFLDRLRALELGRPGSSDPLPELLEHQPVDQVRRDRRRRRTALGRFAAIRLAPVFEAAGTRVHRGLHRVAAAGAAQKARQQTGSPAASRRHDTADGVGLLEQSAIDQGLVGRAVDEPLAAVHLAEVDPVGDHRSHTRDADLVTELGREPRREFRPGFPASPAPEELGDQITAHRRIGLEPSVLPLAQPDRHKAADEYAAVDRHLAGAIPAVPDLAPSHPREAKHDRQAELAEGSCRVKAEVDRGEGAPVLDDLLDQLQCIGDAGAGKAIDVGDDQAAGLTGADPLEDAIKTGPAQHLASLIKVGLPVGDGDSAQLRPAIDLFPLILRRDKALSLATADPRYSNVAIEIHSIRRYEGRRAMSRALDGYTPLGFGICWADTARAETIG